MAKLVIPHVLRILGLLTFASRSAKHSSSTAATHAFDFKRLLNLESFKGILYGIKYKLIDSKTKEGILNLYFIGVYFTF